MKILVINIFTRHKSTGFKALIISNTNHFKLSTIKYCTIPVTTKLSYKVLNQSYFLAKKEPFLNCLDLKTVKPPSGQHLQSTCSRKVHYLK